MSKLDNAICYNCGEILSFIEEQKILRHEECLKCQSSLHCCRMCVFYDKSTQKNEDPQNLLKIG